MYFLMSSLGTVFFPARIDRYFAYSSISILQLAVLYFFTNVNTTQIYVDIRFKSLFYIILQSPKRENENWADVKNVRKDTTRAEQGNLA